MISCLKYLASVVRRPPTIPEPLTRILRSQSGGIYKRIDENRELLTLLLAEAPDVLAAHPWIEGWLQSHDEFFCDLANTVASGDTFLSLRQRSGRPYPRPWPGRPTALPRIDLALLPGTK